ncbi:MAG: VWA domain-containing protein [Candidatus Electrothrix sp. MAN1_4]|nr:VWA domain-containing protein [Candidatus Electrothrix sp. MAN1_4]
MRRLPVYLVLDNSGSMHGEAIEAVKNGMQVLASTLRQDPYALETAFISVITFNTDAEQLVPLTDLVSFQPPDIRAQGITSLGRALQLTEILSTSVRIMNCTDNSYLFYIRGVEFQFMQINLDHFISPAPAAGEIVAHVFDRPACSGEVIIKNKILIISGLAGCIQQKD